MWSVHFQIKVISDATKKMYNARHCVVLQPVGDLIAVYHALGTANSRINGEGVMWAGIRKYIKNNNIKEEKAYSR